jgi:hypothetical protein
MVLLMEESEPLVATNVSSGWFPQAAINREEKISHRFMRAVYKPEEKAMPLIRWL